jgi:hypothetical protein
MEDRSLAGWRVVVPLYLVGGFALGMADPALGRFVHGNGMKPGLATAASVNLVLPLLAVGLAFVSRRLWLAWLGALGMSTAFTLGLAVAYPHGHRWDPVALLRSVPPVLVAACLGYAVLGTLTILTLRGVRRPGGLGTHTPAGRLN